MSDANNWESLKWKPLGERILVKRRTLQEKTKSKLILPKNKDLGQDTLLTEGILIALGDDVNHPLLKPGLAVKWGKHAGFDFIRDGIDHTLMNVGDLVEVAVIGGAE